MHPIREQFIKDMQASGLSEATQHRYLKNVDLFFKAVWCCPAEVTEAMVQDFIIAVRNKDVARETFRGYHYALKCFFVTTMRRDWALLKKNGIRPPAKQRLRAAVTHTQYAAILNAIYTPLYRGIFAVMYGCGLRIGETVALKPGDIDTEAMTLRVIGKGNKERLVPLTQGLLEDLRLVWKGHHCEHWLFPNKANTNPIDAGNVTTLFRKIRRELGLDESLTPHSLRHGFATRLFEQDMPADTIAILMGHDSVKTTKRYLHLTEVLREQVKQATTNFYVPLFD